jgi:hypothetical protein
MASKTDERPARPAERAPQRQDQPRGAEISGATQERPGLYVGKDSSSIFVAFAEERARRNR